MLCVWQQPDGSPVDHDRVELCWRRQLGPSPDSTALCVTAVKNTHTIRRARLQDCALNGFSSFKIHTRIAFLNYTFLQPQNKCAPVSTGNTFQDPLRLRNRGEYGMLYITWYSCNIHTYGKVQLTNNGFLNTNTAITRQLMRTARTLEAEWWQVLRGSVSTGEKEDKSSTGRVWTAGFHHVTARYSLAGVLKLMNRSFI
jgi:hypothetical protein